MNNRTRLAAGIAMSVIAAAAFAPASQAKVVRRHHVRHDAAPAENAELRAEVQELKSEVHTLESRLDAQGQAQQQTQAQVQAAQSQAQAAQTQAQAAQTQVAAAQSQIETIPSQVVTEVKRDVPKPGWEGSTKVGGLIFSDISHIENKNDGVANAQSGTDFDIKRFYIVVDHKFNDTFSANMTTDFTYDLSAKATQLYIKKAYVQAKFSDALILRAGGADTPWIPFVEGIYGYRYVEKVLTDNTGFGTSADWGVHALGSFANGIVSYQVSVVDGAGYKIPAIGTANRTETMDVEGRLSATYDHFTVAVGGYDGRLGKEVTGSPVYHAAQRADALVAYTSDRFRIGGEYFWAKHWSDVLQSTDSKTNTSQGVSGFASFNLTRQFAVFGRYDWVKPQDTTASDFTLNLFNVGVSYTPVKNLDFALVYKRDVVDNGLFSTGNGTIGTLNPTLMGRGTYDEIGLFTRIGF